MGRRKKFPIRHWRKPIANGHASGVNGGQHGPKCKVMIEYRCKNLGGKLVPKSCHVLNGRKEKCENMMVIELDEEASRKKIEEMLKNISF